MIRTGLAEMFPKSSEYLGIEHVIPGGSFIEGSWITSVIPSAVLSDFFLDSDILMILNPGILQRTFVKCQVSIN